MTMFFLMLLQCIIYYINVKILITEKRLYLRESIFLVAVAFLLSNLYQYIGILTAFCIFFFLFYLLLKEKMYSVKKSIILASMSMIIVILTDHVTSYIGSLFFSDNFNDEQLIFVFHYPFQIVLSSGISCAIIRYTRNVRKKINHNEQIQTVLMGINVLLLLSFYGSIILGRYLGQTIELVQLNMFFFFVYTGISIVIFLFYARSLEVKYKAQKKEAEYESMQFYVNEIEKQYTEIRKFKHDYQNILSSLDIFIEEENYANLREYYYKKIKVVSNKIVKNNFGLENLSKIKVTEVKSILATKLMIAQDSGIDTKFEAPDYIDFIPMDSVALVRIMGILLDNAIEELTELKEGNLLVGILKNGDTIIFIVQNTCRSNIPKVHQLKKSGFSTKGKNRGLGLSNLSDLVKEQKNVSLETTIFEDQFIQKVILGGGEE